MPTCAGPCNHHHQITCQLVLDPANITTKLHANLCWILLNITTKLHANLCWILLTSQPNYMPTCAGPCNHHNQITCQLVLDPANITTILHGQLVLDPLITTTKLHANLCWILLIITTYLLLYFIIVKTAAAPSRLLTRHKTSIEFDQTLWKERLTCETYQTFWMMIDLHLDLSMDTLPSPGLTLPITCGKHELWPSLSPVGSMNFDPPYHLWEAWTFVTLLRHNLFLIEVPL